LNKITYMNTLERKEKRWRFLNELYNRGVESVGSQIERTGDEIMIMKIEIELERRKTERENKINTLLK
jgi:hypothetical protein